MPQVDLYKVRAGPLSYGTGTTRPALIESRVSRGLVLPSDGMLRSFGLLVALFSAISFGLCPSLCAFQNASATSKTEKQGGDSDCHGAGSKSSDTPDHRQCNGEECCQPLVLPASDSFSKLSISLATLPVLVSFTVPHAREEHTPTHHVSEATGPPRNKVDYLVLSLSTAPNAPPGPF